MEEVKVCSLASGSNGNVYYIEYGGEALVVDVGISYSKLKNRAMTRHIDLKKIRHAFITHEHSDHVFGLSGLSHRADVRAYMTRGTWKGMREKYRPDASRTTFITIGEPVTVGPFTVYSFAKPHDVMEPCSYRIEAGGVSIGVFTDIGAPCEGLSESLSLCHLAFLESNYDQEMLLKGSYPDYLKKRVISGQGHLSNVQAREVVDAAQTDNLRALFLSHISKDNNRPEIALRAFSDLADRFLIKVMSRDEASDIWRVTREGVAKVPPVIEIPERLDRVPLRVSGQTKPKISVFPTKD